MECKSHFSWSENHFLALMVPRRYEILIMKFWLYMKYDYTKKINIIMKYLVKYYTLILYVRRWGHTFTIKK